MSNPFTKGQKIRLKIRPGIAGLDQYFGQELTVSFVGDSYVSFAEDKNFANYKNGAWHINRFQPVSNPVRVPQADQPAPVPAPARAKNGRFASRTKAPVILRNGSLYNVARKSKGKRVLQVARLKVVTRDSKTATMSRHGKLFLAKVEKLTLAPQSDVDAYLAEAKALESK